MYALNNPVNLGDPSGLSTYGICLSCTIGGVAYATGSICLNADSKFHFNITGTTGGGGTTGITLGAGVVVQFTDANSVKDLEGVDVFSGASGSLVGGWSADVTVGKSSSGNTVSGVSTGPGVGVDFSPEFGPVGFIEVHGGATNTWILKNF